MGTIVPNSMSERRKMEKRSKLFKNFRKGMRPMPFAKVV